MFAIRGLAPIALATSICMFVSACATGPGADGQTRTALDRSINQCIASIAVGALLGALVGAAANRRSVGTGAAVGAGAGAVACAVILAVNNEQDRERIRESRLAALNSGKGDTANYTGSDGQARLVKTSVQPAALPAAPADAAANAKAGIVGPCRRAQTEITVQDKGTVTLDPEIVCRTASGDWIQPTSKTV